MGAFELAKSNIIADGGSVWVCFLVRWKVKMQTRADGGGRSAPLQLKCVVNTANRSASLAWNMQYAV